VAKIVSQREKLYNMLKGVNGVRAVNGVANFVFVFCGKSKQVYQSLLKKGIAVREFEGGLRITAGSDEENSALIAALGETINSFR
jgi:histidinol-phosphate aminotransferase